ncbi:hypothetical protein PHYBOEH_008627 [Phytophthora boehmeriae]|uniref:Uncharacterized protein n=1 Tax=Phytophthora boehmeriae TaxID=109152 RepID=A0A8T1W3H1_9STRA|nr:hypothetical protein PHYBOEH_008627 [Phytophthora boehmeriae]
MEATLDKQTSRRFVKGTGHLLVQLLMIAVSRLRKVEMELGDLGLELEDEQEEIDAYSDDIGDCHDHIEDIDEFVRELKAGNVSAISDATSVLVEMAEEREENQNLLRILADTRSCHEGRLCSLLCAM